MPLAKPAAAPRLLTQSGGAMDSEFARVLRTGDPGPALDGPLTFSPPAAASPAEWLRAWHAWRLETFAPAIAPLLAAVAAHAERGGAREIQTLDLGLDAALDPAARTRSTAAGGRLLRRLAVSRGERWLDKLHRWSTAGATPAHFPVVFAGQSALFHLPLRLLLPAYAYWEWCAALAACPPVNGVRPEFSVEVGELCQLAQEILSSPSPYAVERNFPAASGGS